MKTTRLTYHNEEFLLVTNGDQWILAHSDLVHYVRQGNETVTLEYMDFESLKIGVSAPVSSITHEDELTLADLTKLANDNPVTKDALADWIHYFGIKDRVRRNYSLFKASLKEIGVNPSELLPEWR